MTTSAQSRKMDEIRKDLFSDNDATVMRALNKCHDQGNASLVEPLLALYATTSNNLFKTTISEMLSSLKVTGAEEAFLAALKNPEMKNIHTEILSFMWNSGIQPVEGVADITRMSLKGGYDMMLEALTLVESIDDPISEEILLESISDVRQELSDKQGSENRTLLAEYLRVLEGKLAGGDEDF